LGSASRQKDTPGLESELTLLWDPDTYLSMPVGEAVWTLSS
jgi:hypothetical protein